MKKTPEHIESRQNSHVSHLRRLGSDAKYRRVHGEFLCEGPTMLEEAVLSGLAPGVLLFDRAAGLPENPEIPENTRVYSASAAAISRCSELSASRGIVFSAPMRTLAFAPGTPALLLDSVSDPGNLGTILRIADAFSMNVALTGECADIFSPKTVRSSMGSVFRVPVALLETHEVLPFFSRLGLPLLGAVPMAAENGPGRALTLGKDPLPRCAAVIGNEARGVSREILELCEETLTILTPGHAQSLNAAVAAGIICYEMRRNA